MPSDYTQLCEELRRFGFSKDQDWVFSTNKATRLFPGAWKIVQDHLLVCDHTGTYWVATSDTSTKTEFKTLMNDWGIVRLSS
jgi:hypothetical protein